MLGQYCVVIIRADACMVNAVSPEPWMGFRRRANEKRDCVQIKDYNSMSSPFVWLAGAQLISCHQQVLTNDKSNVAAVISNIQSPADH